MCACAHLHARLASVLRGVVRQSPSEWADVSHYVRTNLRRSRPPIRRRRSACVRWTAARAPAARSDPALSTRRLSGCSACACSCPPGPRRLPPAASGSGGARRGGPGLGHRGFPARIPFWLFLVPVAAAMLAASPRDAVFAAGCPSASLVGSPASLQHFLEECAESGPVACFASGQSVALLCVRSCFG